MLYFLFPFSSKYILISFEASSLVHILLRSALFNFQVFSHFPIFCYCFLFLLWSENILCRISFSPFIFVRVRTLIKDDLSFRCMFFMHLKRMCILLLLDGVLYKFLLDPLNGWCFSVLLDLC